MPHANTPAEGPAYGFGLTEGAVRQLQDILRRKHGVELSLPEAWSRACELLAFGRLLIDGLPPKRSLGQRQAVRASSPLTSSTP